MSIELLKKQVWNEDVVSLKWRRSTSEMKTYVVSNIAFYGKHGFNLPTYPNIILVYKIYLFLLSFLCRYSYWFFIVSVPVDHTFFLANFCTASLASSSSVGVLPKQHPAGGAPTGSSSGSGITGNTLSDQCNILIINPKYYNKLVVF